MRLIALILMLIAPSWAVAEKIAKDLTLSQVGPIYVSLIDSANGGCWTNLKEVKTYASNKIELTGGTLVDEIQDALAKGIIFNVNVLADRHPQTDSCYGSISVDTKALGSAAHLPNSYSWVIYSDISGIAMQKQNFNTIILDTVKTALDEWQ